MSPPPSTGLDPELRYLVMLTRAGLKPLSRWEASLDRDARRAIQRRGLAVDTVTRRTRLGRKVHETVFAKRSAYTGLYRKRYQGSRLVDSPADARFQGQLFGYPSCCVDAFIREPYTPNSLDSRDQEILFHWACPSCNATPGVVRDYRRAQMIWGDHCAAPTGSRGLPRTWKSSGVGKVAASLALAASTAALATSVQNPHHSYVLDDGDRDGFSVGEEVLMGTNWHRADTDGDGIVDGDQLGTLLASMITAPAPWINVQHFAMLGLVTCEVCGEDVNMGYVVIENWLNGMSIQLNYIALHALENGCMVYSYRYCPWPCGLFTGQLDLDLLKRVLEPGLLHPHSVPARAGDSDGDGLTDDEEEKLGTDPNSGGDGARLAEELLPIIAGLPRVEHHNRPYLIEREMDGVEQCEICGETFNMGHIDIVSPLDEMTVSVPYVALHMLAHGGFAYDGTVNDGEVLPLILRTVLTANGSSHWVTIAGDTDDDGLLDSEEAYFGLDPSIGDEDNTGRGDGREIAVRMATKISVLPEGPLPNQTHVIHHPTRGYYDCLVCGQPVDMGYMEVVDPVAGKSVDVPYYSHHFMELGSYSTDRDDLYSRVDPTQLGEVLDITTITGVNGATPPPFSFVSAPNPFGPEGGTRLRLTLPAAGPVEVAIFDVKGRRVQTLFSGNASEPELVLRWNGVDGSGRTVAAGTYFCRVRIGQAVVSRKLTLIH